MLLEYLRRRWFLVLTLAGLYIALQFPGQTQRVFGHVETRYVAAIALFFMSTSLPTRRLWHAAIRPTPALLAIAVTWGLAPVLAWLAAPILLPQKFQHGLVVVACVPCTLASAAIWTRMGGGNEAIALLVTMATNLFVFVGTAGWLVALTGRSISFEIPELIGVLMLFVVVPVVAGQGFRAVRPIGWWIDEHRPFVKIVSQLMVFLIIIKAAVQANKELAAQATAARTMQELAEGPPRNEGAPAREDEGEKDSRGQPGKGAEERIGKGRLKTPSSDSPEINPGGRTRIESWNARDLLDCAVVCIGLHLVLLFVGFTLGKRLFAHEDAVAVGIAGSQKTLPVAAIIVADYFTSEPLAIVPVLFFHVGQLIVDTFIVEYFFPWRRKPVPDPR